MTESDHHCFHALTLDLDLMDIHLKVDVGCRSWVGSGADRSLEDSFRPKHLEEEEEESGLAMQALVVSQGYPAETSFSARNCDTQS